jgi:hypothetical protein
MHNTPPDAPLCSRLPSLLPFIDSASFWLLLCVFSSIGGLVRPMCYFFCLILSFQSLSESMVQAPPAHSKLAVKPLKHPSYHNFCFVWCQAFGVTVDVQNTYCLTKKQENSYINIYTTSLPMFQHATCHPPFILYAVTGLWFASHGQGHRRRMTHPLAARLGPPSSDPGLKQSRPLLRWPHPQPAGHFALVNNS